MTPRLLIAIKYGSGSGFGVSTSSKHTIALKKWETPEPSNNAVTADRGLEVTIARGRLRNSRRSFNVSLGISDWFWTSWIKFRSFALKI
jgi:hypothetical protein